MPACASAEKDDSFSGSADRMMCFTAYMWAGKARLGGKGRETRTPGASGYAACCLGHTQRGHMYLAGVTGGGGLLRKSLTGECHRQAGTNESPGCLHSRDVYFTQNLSEDRIHAFLHIATMFT